MAVASCNLADGRKKPDFGNVCLRRALLLLPKKRSRRIGWVLHMVFVCQGPTCERMGTRHSGFVNPCRFAGEQQSDGDVFTSTVNFGQRKSQLRMSRQEIETALALLSRASDAELKGLQNTDAFIDARRKISRCTRSAQSDDLPQQLLDAILDSLDDIKAYVAKSPKETVGEPSYLKEDFRITDYRSATGKRTTDLTSKFRAHLGARSYAQDVISWEIRKYHTSRVDELVDDLSQSQDKTSGHITEFLGVSKCPRIAKNITGYGIKILVLERLYRSVGLSIVLAAHYWKLSRLRYGQFEVFLRLLRAKTDICRFIDCTGEYIEECQTYYDRTGAHWEPQIEKSLDGKRLSTY